MGDDVKDFMAAEGYDPEYGARPLRRVIQRSIEDPMALKLISGEFPDECTVHATMDNGEVVFKITETKPSTDDHEDAETTASTGSAK
jgi:ATP-dependent Clp protease ATP-binding subunit ClpB